MAAGEAMICHALDLVDGPGTVFDSSPAAMRKSRLYFLGDNGAPDRIRTHDPQIRSLLYLKRPALY